MAVQRPDPSNPASFYASVQSLCDAADALAGQVSAIGQGLTTAQQAIGAEVQGRQQSVAAESQARAQADNSEAQARAQGIAAEAQTRSTALAQEQQDRTAAIGYAVQDLRSAISALGDSLRQALNAETTARTTADAAEQQSRTAAINGQAQTLAATVRSLQAAIDAKASASDLDAIESAQAKALADAVAAQSKALADAVARIRTDSDALAAAVGAQRLDFVAPVGRPGDAPTRYTFVTAASALGGSRGALPLVPASMLTSGDGGAIIRVDGSGIVASRAALAVEPGRLYRTRYVVQRRANPADPSGDAVVCGIVYLDQSLRVLGDVVAVRAFPALVTANGRQESEALISRSVGLGAAFQAPASARFMVPVVAVYGPDALTDVEVLSVEDVSGAFVLAPPIADFEARLAALEGADLAARVQLLESEAGTPSKMTFGSKGDASYAAIPDSVQVVELLGRRFAGDGGGGRYVRTVAQVAAGADSFVSHGAVFLRETVAADVVAGMLESGFETWIAGLPTDPPPQSGKRWNDHGTPVVTP